MEPQYTIGGLARAAGVPTSTVRYYERVGLVEPTGRTAGNYRYYGAEALERLQFIRAAQATGLTLEDITALLPLRAGVPSCCQRVQRLIHQRLSDVKRRMADLRRVAHVLESALDGCRRTQRPGYCEVNQKLSECPCCSPHAKAGSGKKSGSQFPS
jgi:DNA-binding transcriptional MerR regulator